MKTSDYRGLGGCGCRLWRCAFLLDGQRPILTFVKMPKRSEPATRARVLALLRSGEATPADAARLGGVSRQVVHQWCEAERIDWRAAYEWRLQIAWEKTEQPLARRRRISKASLRAQADQAVKEWEKRSG